MKCDLPYIKAYRDRHGTRRYYFRRKTQNITLPGEPGSPEFITAYQRELESKPQQGASSKATSGTLAALRDLYFESAEFKNLAQSTQRETRYVIDALCAVPDGKGGTRGDKRVSTLECRHILEWRDRMAEKPGAANKMLRIVKALLSFSIQRGYRKDNPAKGIKPLKIGRFRSWTDAELIAFEEKWPLGSLERTGYALALYTGQRRADLAAMKWSQIGGDVIHVTQHKTGTDLTLPIHPELRTALNAVRPRKGETILTTKDGGEISPIYFGAIMAQAIENAGLPKTCVLHGLRKTTARIVAETGGKVSAMTGHLSEQMEREYSRDANQAEMARVAVLKWTNARGKNKA